MTGSEIQDPFGLADLRESTLQSWRSSPTRLAEDLATETDLAAIGYRDRLLVELAANAADAAVSAGIAGRLAVWISDAGELVVANTGAPVTLDGVRSLLATRVSPKHVDDAAGPTVGRFGVGFSAVVAVADRVEVRSTTGSFVFDRDRAADLLGVDTAPLLRMAWATDAAPPDGYDTAVVLTLPSGKNSDLLSAMVTATPDLLLELTALQQISIGDEVFSITRTPVVDGISAVEVTSQNATQQWLESTSEHARWLVQIRSGAPVMLGDDRLRAPTETDIELSLPARCVAAVALTPDRRQLYPGTDIRSAATGYVELVRALDPAHRPQMVPQPGLARNSVDAELREAVLERLRNEPWLPRADASGTQLDDVAVAGSVAVAFPDASDELATLLGRVRADVVSAAVSLTSDLARLAQVGVSRLSLADLANAVSAVDRRATWWRDLYEALSPYVSSKADADELGALPVPRADGRMNFGARGLHISAAGTPSVSWLPTVADDAVHPLLERLGAELISTSELLAMPELRTALEEAEDALDDMKLVDDAERLTAEVLGVLAAQPDATTPAWVAGVLLADVDGELARGDELLLPDSPLAQVLVEDSPFGLVADDVVARWGTDVLRRAGVGWGFSLIVDDLPTGPDHDLPDEQEWFDALDSPPDQLVAVRDLDLVADDKWSLALTMLAEPELAQALSDPESYTCWWLRTYARIDGKPLGELRSPDDADLDELLDPLDHPRASAVSGALASLPLRNATAAVEIIRTLGDADREVSPGQAVVGYCAIAQALASGVLHPADVDDAEFDGALRAIDGSVVTDAVIVDEPWWLELIEPQEAVVVSVPVESAAARGVADALDVPTASEAFQARVVEPGEPSTWGRSVEAMRFAARHGMAPGDGEIRVHDTLQVELRRDDRVRVVEARWWVDGGGVTHLAGQLL